MYLQEALINGPAIFVIQGFTRMLETYEEAIKCLKEQYVSARLVQEEQMCSIVHKDAVPVKNGSDKELCCFYDAAIQHYPAKGRKDWFIWNGADSNTSAEAGRKEMVKVGRV